MKFQLVIVAFIVAGALSGTGSNGANSREPYGRNYFQRKYGLECRPRNCWTPTTKTTTTAAPVDPCASLQCPHGLKVTAVNETHATYVTYLAPGRDGKCACFQGGVECGPGAVLNLETCIEGGSSFDGCQCGVPQPFFG